MSLTMKTTMYPLVTSSAKTKKNPNLTPNAKVIKTNRMIHKMLQTRKDKTNTLRRFLSLMKTPRRTTTRNRRATKHPKPQGGTDSSL